ncbi:MAG TPA: glucokinase [Azospirillaceae bacterium]|nr:glucokinase [Azospirillaceae bacterium]
MGPGTDTPLALAADIGGTNARFALLDVDGTAHATRILKCADHPTMEAAVEAYLDAAAPRRRPRSAAIAVAGPVTGDRFSMTNHRWSFSRAEAERRLGLERLVLVNDFTAVALGMPHLKPGDRRPVGSGEPVPGQVIGVIGPGSGLGVSGLVPTGNGWVALATEGGHVTVPPVTEREAAVLAHLHARFQHVSAERVISGMGLTNLYEALCRVDGKDPAQLEPAEITAAGIAGKDPHCTEAVDMMCALLGTVAGNLALTLGARGGIYIAGGIVPRLGEYFDRSAFRERFMAKGRMRTYLEPVPTYVVTHPLPAFLGLAAVLAQTRAD